MGLPRELAVAFGAIVAITAFYVTWVTALGIPAASGLIGHSLGIIGFVLMLMTETLYSLRKRAMRRPWGTMRSWLRFHIVTGIVGPYLVVLHAAWTFDGLAGWLTVMTVVVAGSGFLGRYIYTAVPRTADGAIVEAQVLQSQLEDARREAALATGVSSSAIGTRGRIGRATDAGRAQRRLRELERQVSALRWARRMLATWHTIHIPLGMVLFVLGFAHIAAAIHYATLLR